jgi:hypothetical protein
VLSDGALVVQVLVAREDISLDLAAETAAEHRKRTGVQAVLTTRATN